MPHSNICRGAREIFLYPIRGYSLGGIGKCVVIFVVKNLKSQISVVEMEKRDLCVYFMYIYYYIYIIYILYIYNKNTNHISANYNKITEI